MAGVDCVAVDMMKRFVVSSVACRSYKYKCKCSEFGTVHNMPSQ